MAAPRMFCDICDQFDLHETEDCPRQAQDFLDTEKVVKPPKKTTVERPYCENCESKNLFFKVLRIAILFTFDCNILSPRKKTKHLKFSSKFLK